MDDYQELLKRARANISVQETKRFEMPVASSSVVGRQTAVRNFFDVAKNLRREPKHLAKYLSKELAVPGEIRGAELFLQGKFPSSMINKRVEDYAKEFVLCHECGKPDTVMQTSDRFEFVASRHGLSSS
jgi:translation initiation factor 2 subunit 2